MKRPALGSFQHALLAPHISPTAGVSPKAAHAILEFKAALLFAGWTPAEVQIELGRTSTTKGKQK